MGDQAAQRQKTTKQASPNRQSAAPQKQSGVNTMPVFKLQQTMGNRAFKGLLQAKLAVSRPEDRWEQEADRVAEKIMQAPSGLGSSGTGGNKPTSGTGAVISRYPEAPGAAPEAPAAVHEAFRSSGQPLSPATRAFMEPRFGRDFSHVRVHNDSQAAESARSVNALAYTVGRDIVFGQGRYAPGTSSGDKLLAHELTHVVQQDGLSVQVSRKEAAPAAAGPAPAAPVSAPGNTNNEKMQQLQAEAKQDAQKIKQIFRENTWLGPRNQGEIMEIIQAWANKPPEASIKMTPFDYLVVALRGATFETGALVKQLTSAFDQIFERMDKDHLARFQGFMQRQARIFKDEKAIETVKFEVSKEDMLDAVSLSAEVAAAFATGGGSVLAQILIWLGKTLPGLYQKASAVMGFVNTIRSFKLDDIKKLLSPRGLGDLLVRTLFGEVQGLPSMGEDEAKEEKEPEGGREDRGLMKVFSLLMKVFHAFKKVYGKVAGAVGKILSVINITNKPWFPNFSMVYAAVVRVVQAVSDPGKLLNEVTGKLKSTVSDFFKNIKGKITETAGEIKAKIELVAKPAQLMKVLADKAVEMVLNFIISNPPSALVKLAFKAIETGAKKSIVELVRENIPFADKLITNIAESDTVTSMMKPLQPPIEAVGGMTDRLACEAGAVIDEAEGRITGVIGNGAQMVKEFAGVSTVQSEEAAGKAPEAKEKEQTGAGEGAQSGGDFLGTVKQGVHTRLMAAGERNLLEKGKELGKAALEKGKDAAKKLGSKIKGLLLGAVESFKIGREDHELWVEQQDDGEVEVMIASKATPIDKKIKAYRSALDDIHDSTQREKAEGLIRDLVDLNRKLKIAAKKSPAKIQPLEQAITKIMADFETIIAQQRTPGKEDNEVFKDMTQFRKDTGLPNTGNRKIDGVITRLDIKGRSFYGVNSWAADDATARKAFKEAGLLTKSGKVPHSAFCNHAEGDVFLQAFKAKARGGIAKLYVDAEVCDYCKGNLDSMTHALGLEKLEVWEKGNTKPMIYPE